MIFIKCNFLLCPLVFFHDFIINLCYYFSILRPISQNVIALLNLLILILPTQDTLYQHLKGLFSFFCLYIFQKLSKNSIIIGLAIASALDMGLCS
jgi:hypothetical protein